MPLFSYLFYFIAIELFLHQCSADVFELNKDNHTLLANYRLALVAYSADWCFFSRQLAPVFAEASNRFIEDTKKAQVLFGRVDCDANGDLCASFKITKYPTIKLFKFGALTRKEFRQQRTADALAEFVNHHAKENITTVDGLGRPALDVVNEIKDSTDSIIGAFLSNDTSNTLLQYFKMIAHLERDNCAFHMVSPVNESSGKLFFKDHMTSNVEELVLPANFDFTYVRNWAENKCNPLIRELTFANAEEIIDEGLPLLILFYDSASAHLKVTFRTVVEKHLTGSRKQLNFVTAAGHDFTAPLRQMGKTEKDLPLICIDSLAHMYGHPKPVAEILSDPIHLTNFIRDLNSGKLHREFHNGPDKVETPAGTPTQKLKHVDEESPTGQTSPPESAFKKLKPSFLKYTLLHDEL